MVRVNKLLPPAVTAEPLPSLAVHALGRSQNAPSVQRQHCSLQKQELLGKIVARTRGGTALSGVATITLGSHIPSNTSMAMYAHHGPMF